MIRIDRYKARYWAIWRDAELLAVVVDRKGAERLAAELQKQEGGKG